MQGFRFLRLDRLPVFEDSLVGRVPTGISDSSVLLRSVADALSFPAYFGQNWNALSDCLRDLHWTDMHDVVLVHEDVPRVSSGDLKIYLEVLRDAAADWTPGEPHELVVVFDEKDRESVTGALMG